VKITLTMLYLSFILVIYPVTIIDLLSSAYKQVRCVRY
jgi:hypothetical protein